MSAAGNGTGAPVLDEARNYLRIVHSIPGRLRVRWHVLRDLEPEQRADIYDRCVTHPGIAEVQLRPLTGSILVVYDHEHLSVRAVLDLLRDATGAKLVLSPHEPAPPRPESPVANEPTRLAIAAARFFEEINADVREATDGRADLATLLPLSFLGLGLAEIATTREAPTPPWWSLFWWSFRSFLSLNEPAIEEAAEE